MKLDIHLHPKISDKQKRILRTDKCHLLIDGPAGTAKTYTAIARALIRVSRDETERLVIVRSPVEIREIGHLPGDADEKLAPYAAPYIDLLNELSPKANYKSLVHKGIIEFVPTTFLRGTTFHNAIILVDEFQNLSAHELDTIVTRVGEGTQLILCGDTGGQSDLRSHETDKYRDVYDVLLSMRDDFEIVTLGVEDIVRSGFVKRYYMARLERDGERLPKSITKRT